MTTQTPTEAAQNLIDTLHAAIADPTFPVETVQAAAQTAHDVIQAHGGDTADAFKNTHS